jgi:uncharacterized membrane protein
MALATTSRTNSEQARQQLTWHRLLEFRWRHLDHAPLECKKSVVVLNRLTGAPIDKSRYFVFPNARSTPSISITSARAPKRYIRSTRRIPAGRSDRNRSVIAVGAIEASLGIARIAVRSGETNQDRLAVSRNFARWLVADLTFQLAADIVNTSLAPIWNELGRLASIAAIRTFLSFLLNRELADTRNLQHREASKIP